MKEKFVGFDFNEVWAMSKDYDYPILRSVFGIAPHEHEYIPEITASATCTEDGVITYMCECDDSYTELIPAIGHIDADEDYICDNGCGFEYEKPSEPEPEDDCPHICHDEGFMGFIWKIVRFFNKLFGSNPVCECGVAHY